MAHDTIEHQPAADDELKRSITGRQLFFYTLGDVLGSGIYVLIGLVAAAVGGAFWIAFAVGVTIAAITGSAYAELVTKYPKAAGAALYVNKAFGNKALTFLITVSFLSASFAAAGSLASGFAVYFARLWEGPPALAVTLLFILALTIVNFIGITQSVVVNMLMAFVEIVGLVIVLVIGIWHIAEGNAEFGTLTEFDTGGDHWSLAILAGVALSFFAMTGFENTANVAEETVDPQRSFPRSLIGGMAVAGVIYVLVSVAAALTVPTDRLADSDAALLEVVEAGILPVDTGLMSILFAVIAMIAITNTTLVAVVTQPRILYGMANEDVVPGVFAKIHATRRSPWVGLLFSGLVVGLLLVVGTYAPEVQDTPLVERLALVTVLFLLFIYALVIVACLKLRGQDETERTFRASTPLLLLGLVGNIAILAWSVYDDPTSLLWCAGLVAVGLVLFLLEYFFGQQDRPEGAERGDPSLKS
ncbi:APC family permease [Nocardioides sp. SYSU DS0663]|uniref:APC family permease n=1 Tax=Nocardioides sp. SYSU DS0663 TaxID=3416445 RepID=UPI003F4BDE8B